MMSEADWIRCGDSEALSGDWVALAALGDRVSARKLRLFVCACCRLIPVVAQEAHRRAIDVGERFADGEVADGVRETAYRDADRVNGMGALPCKYCVYQVYTIDTARYASHAAAGPQTKSGTAEEQMAHKRRNLLGHAKLIREIFGGTLLPVPFAADWRTRTAVALAQQMNESRDFSAMPILADALEDAGCEIADILAHCRGTGPHVRGCWVVDLVLSKS